MKLLSFLQILDEASTGATFCTDEITAVLGIVRWVLNIICFVVPIILIVLVTLDVAKVVTAGNIDDKIKKEVTQKLVTRIVFAVIIFLIPTLVSFLFKSLPNAGTGLNDTSWWTCWDKAK